MSKRVLQRQETIDALRAELERAEKAAHEQAMTQWPSDTLDARMARARRAVEHVVVGSFEVEEYPILRELCWAIGEPIEVDGLILQRKKIDQLDHVWVWRAREEV